jgi:uncharacterized protein (TIGR02646 family)
LKYIIKGNEPKEFTEWKTNEPNAVYEDLKDPEKSRVIEFLLNEQGFICCYCGGRIELANSNIEHVITRKDSPDKELDFQNFLASCSGGISRESKQHKHCNNYRSDKELPISPFDKNCETYFKYKNTGEVISSKKRKDSLDDYKKVEMTLENLGLNSEILKEKRKNLINQTFELIGKGMINDISEEIKFYQSKQENKYQPFCFVIYSYLKDFE